MGKVLVIRTCDKNLKAEYNGFKYPAKGRVVCPDWNPVTKCGNGLHGLLWGCGDWSLLAYDYNAKYLLIEVDEKDLVVIDKSKVKFKQGDVVYSGNAAGAISKILTHTGRINELAKKQSPSIINKSGYGGFHEVSQDNNAVININSGDSTGLTTGMNSVVSIEGSYGAAITSGYYSISNYSGNIGKSISFGTSSLSITEGDNNLAVALGTGGRAASKGQKNISVNLGSSGIAENEGENSIAIGYGDGAKVRSGKNGCITIINFINGRFKVFTAYVGRNNIKANTWYKHNKKKFVQC